MTSRSPRTATGGGAKPWRESRGLFLVPVPRRLGASLSSCLSTGNPVGQLLPGRVEATGPRQGAGAPGAPGILAWLSVKPLLWPGSSMKPFCAGRINHAVR